MKLLSLCASIGLSWSWWGKIELIFQFSFPRVSPMPMLAKSSVVRRILCVASDLLASRFFPKNGLNVVVSMPCAL